MHRIFYTYVFKIRVPTKKFSQVWDSSLTERLQMYNHFCLILVTTLAHYDPEHITQLSVAISPLVPWEYQRPHVFSHTFHFIFYFT